MPQDNKFVVFPGFWTKTQTQSRPAKTATSKWVGPLLPVVSLQLSSGGHGCHVQKPESLLWSVSRNMCAP